MLQAIALWLHADLEATECKLAWWPRGEPDLDGSWPVCSHLPPPHMRTASDSVVSKKKKGGAAEESDHCTVYSVGIGGLPRFDIDLNSAGCAVRSFDPTVERPKDMPESIRFKKLGLSGKVARDASMPVTTLTDMMTENNEKGESLYILKVDCEGCEVRLEGGEGGGGGLRLKRSSREAEGVWVWFALL